MEYHSLSRIPIEPIHRSISTTLLASAGLWLLSAFITYTLAQAGSAVQLHFAPSSASAISLPTVILVTLSIVYTLFGISFANRSKGSWRHLLAASIVYFSVGLYLLTIWETIAPGINHSLQVTGRMSPEEIAVCNNLARACIVIFLLIAPGLTVLALIHPDMLKRFHVHSVVHSGPRNLFETVLMWYSFGLAILFLLGATYDQRTIEYWGITWSSQWLWLSAGILVLIGGLCTYIRKPPWLIASTTLNLIGGAIAAGTVLETPLIGNISDLEPRYGGVFIASTALASYSVSFIMFMLLNLRAQWHSSRTVI